MATRMQKRFERVAVERLESTYSLVKLLIDILIAKDQAANLTGMAQFDMMNSILLVDT